MDCKAFEVSFRAAKNQQLKVRRLQLRRSLYGCLKDQNIAKQHLIFEASIQKSRYRMVNA